MNPNRSFQETGQTAPIALTSLTQPVQPLNVTAPTIAPIPPIAAPAAPTPAAAPAKPAQSPLLDQIEGLQRQLTSQGSDTDAAIANATAPYEKQLNDINQQLVERQAQALANQEAVRAGGGDVSFQSGESQRVARNDAIEVLRLQALQAGAQGNIALAQKKAQTAIDTKYAQLQQDITAAKQNIYANWDSFTPEERKRAEATLLSLNNKDTFIQNQKDVERQTSELATTAASNGADAALINHIMDAGSVEDAIALAAPYISPATHQIVNLDDGRSQLIDTRTGRVIATYGSAPAPVVMVAGGGGGGSSTTPSSSKLAPSSGGDPTVQYYAQLLAEGKINLSNVPQNVRNAVVLASKGNINSKLDEGALTSIRQSETAISQLNDLKSKVQSNLQYIGPLKGFAALNPFSQARKVQADINRVRQTVGKALEGGVLRKEDEDKYKKILATITDTPDTAIYKIDQLIASITADIDHYKALQSQSGRFVPSAPSTDLRSKYNY